MEDRFEEKYWYIFIGIVIGVVLTSFVYAKQSSKNFAETKDILENQTKRIEKIEKNFNIQGEDK